MTALPTNDGAFISLASLSLTKDSGDPHIEQLLAEFEAEERKRLGLEELQAHYTEALHNDPTTANRHKTTILVSGLTMAHDLFVVGALNGLGYKVEHLPCPDHDALRYGKEFGNRGQCNPTYFTVGNLIKALVDMREGGMSTEEIIDKHVFMTAGSCGPCRFGMYVTEYRKALRDAGFEGFRVLLFQMNGGLKQAAGDDDNEGLAFSPAFFIGMLKAFIAGDVLNAIGYRIRPYEVVDGATDKAMDAAKAIIHDALYKQTLLPIALIKARRIMAAVKVDKTRVKPKVGITGEFWAMTTEGDGSYRMPWFLGQEGAEVDVPLVTQWICFMVWEGMRDTVHRMSLRGDDEAKKGLAGKNAFKTLWSLRGANVLLRGIFQSFAQVMGLHGYRIINMYEMAAIAGDFYNNDIRGGEAHLEIAKTISNVVKSKVHMTLSIKPFGCMPSSGISDGVQGAVTELYPDAIFLPVETTGDGAVNVYSRVQMMLFKARQLALKEQADVLEGYGMSEETFKALAKRLPLINRSLFTAPHRHASTAADLAELVGSIRHPVTGVKRYLAWRKRPGYKTGKVTIGARATHALKTVKERLQEVRATA